MSEGEFKVIEQHGLVLGYELLGSSASYQQYQPINPSSGQHKLSF
jgi:hypothetical protein